MSERCRVSIMGKDGSLSKATKSQKTAKKITPQQQGRKPPEG